MMPDPVFAFVRRVESDPYFVAHALRCLFGPEWPTQAQAAWGLSQEQVCRLAMCRRPVSIADVARIAEYVGLNPALVAELE